MYFLWPHGLWDLISPTRDRTWQWKQRVLTAGPPGNSLGIFFYHFTQIFVLHSSLHFPTRGHPLRLPLHFQTCPYHIQLVVASSPLGLLPLSLARGSQSLTSLICCFMASAFHWLATKYFDEHETIIQTHILSLQLHNEMECWQWEYMCICVHTHTHTHTQTLLLVCGGSLLPQRAESQISVYTMTVQESCQFHFLFIFFTFRKVLEELAYHGWYGLWGW